MVKVHIVPRNQKEKYMSLIPPELLQRDLTLIGAYDDVSGEIVGALAAHAYEGEMEVAYIVVTKSHLRQGIGSAMLNMLVTMSQALLADRITASYVKKLEDKKQIEKTVDYSRPLDVFFEKNGFSMRDSSQVYAVKIVKLGRNLPDVGKLPTPAKIVPLREITDTKWNLLRERLHAEGEAHALQNEVQSDGEDFEPIFLDPGDMKRYDRNVSCLYYNGKGEVAGCLLMSKRLDGVYMDYFCLLDKDMVSKKAMVAMFDYAYQETVNVHDVAVIFYVNTANKASDNIFSKLAGASKKQYGTACERGIDF